MMLTINELAKKTGLSSYEIRRRVHAGQCPHTRVGAKQTKILINEDVFNRLLVEESHNNMASKHKPNTSETSPTDTIGFGRLRRID